MNTFKMINAVEAKKIMDSTSCKILDVRTNKEFEDAHIFDAINLPLSDVSNMAENVLPNKDEKILIYCRSGRRSKEAAHILCQKGYTNIIEFGGIISWPFDIVI